MNNKQVVLECRKTKIELEHEVLMREMEASLVGEVGLPITAITLTLQLNLWQNPTIMVLLAMFSAIGMVLFDDFRSDRKEKMIAKQKELDALMIELTKSKAQ